MKKITFLMALFAVISMNAQVTLYDEDFETYVATDNVGEDTDIPGTFLSYDVDGDTFNWGLSNPINFSQPMDGIYTGNFIMSASYITVGVGGNGGQGALSPNNILVLPMISIPSGASGVELSYYVGSGTDTAFFSETYSVTVTTSSAMADILSATPILTTTLAFQGGEYINLDLDSFAGQDVYIAFRHHDTFDQWLLGLDEIKVEASVLSVDDNIFEGFKYFVTAENQLNLRSNSPMEQIQLFNILGQMVITQKLSNTNEVISLSNLDSGLYIANVIIDGQMKSFKIVRR